MKNSCRSALIVMAVLAFGLATAPITAQDSQHSKAVLRMLDEELEMKDFLAPMNLKEALELLMQKFMTKGKSLPILVEAEALTRAIGGIVYDTQVQFMPYPKTMSARAFLEIMLTKVDPPVAAYLLRRGSIIITTKEMAGFDALRKDRVRANFNNRPLTEALDDLADQTGADITVDKRVTENCKSLVTAFFRNSTLEDAVMLLADQADLKAVALPSGFYVTSPENAERLQRELEEKKNESVKKK